jgi:hypothetical protein
MKNFDKNYQFTGGKHSQCSDMLVKIENARVTSSASTIVQIRFVYGFQ